MKGAKNKESKNHMGNVLIKSDNPGKADIDIYAIYKLHICLLSIVTPHYRELVGLP